jgi:hypothetical protein
MLGDITADSRATSPGIRMLLVRHAEKAAQPADDPPLTPDGRRRAEALAVAVKDAQPTTIITCGYRKSYPGWRRCRDGLCSLFPFFFPLHPAPAQPPGLRTRPTTFLPRAARAKRLRLVIVKATDDRLD